MPADSYGGIVSTRELLRSAIQTSRCCDLRSAEESSCFDGPAGRSGVDWRQTRMQFGKKSCFGTQPSPETRLMPVEATSRRAIQTVSAGLLGVTTGIGRRLAVVEPSAATWIPCSGSEHLAAPISALWPPLDRAAELLALADWAPDDVASFRLACWSFAGQLS